MTSKKALLQSTNNAITRLIEENKGLVIMIAKKFLNRGYDMEELIQLGNIGLFKAIKNFDTSKNVKFSTYAVPMIMGEIRQFIRDDNIIKVSRSKKDLYLKIISVKEQFFKSHGYEPSISELATILNVSYEEIVVSLDALAPPKYLNQVLPNDTYVVDTVKDTSEEFCDTLIDKIFITNVVNSFSELEKKIFYLRFYKDMTQSQIGKALNIPQVRVSRTLTKLLSHFK